MFIIEHRAAGVLAALALSLAMVLVSNLLDRRDEVTASQTADSPITLASAVGPGVSPRPAENVAVATFTGE